MNYTQEMNLQSKSGYCMPFEERKGEVRMSLDYGIQVHPKSGEEFFHHGIDFITKHYLLSACADGIVSGIGSDARHGLFQVIRYGNYEVTLLTCPMYWQPLERRLRREAWRVSVENFFI